MTGRKSTFISRMFTRRSIEDVLAESTNNKLHRSLGRFHMLFIGIGCIVGAGIFVRTGNAAAMHAGPAVVISFFLASLVCALTGLCYAELASALPTSGSSYTYSYISMGRFVAWIVGCLLILEFGLAASAVAVGWSGYLVSFLAEFNVVIPPQFAAPTGHNIMFANGTTGTAICNLPAMLISGLLSCILMCGIKESASVNSLIVFVKTSVILIFVVAGGIVILINFPHFVDNWTPFLPHNTGEYGSFGVTGILRAASIVVFAYLGFETITTTGLEAKNPQRDMPFALLGSLAICTLIYALVAIVLTLSTPYSLLNVPDPLAVAMDHLGPDVSWLAMIVKGGAVLGLTSVILVLMYGQTRIFYAMANDGFLPPIFSAVHQRFQTPWFNTIFVGMITTIAAGVFDINVIGDLTSVGTLAAFVVVGFSVIQLRKAAPNLPRSFLTPLYPWTPIATILASIGLALSVGAATLKFFAMYLIIAAGVYVIWDSKFLQYDRENRDRLTGPH